VDGPAIFAIETSESVVPTITVSQLSGLRVAVQNESASYWTFEFDYGEGFAIPYATLREAFEAVKAGQADVVVGDAAVCAYIARDFPEFGFAGQFGSAQPIGIAVKKDAVELEQQIRATLDAISADGVLASITKKWLGAFPALKVEQAQ
jgi:ABC-type amino acid transport substrate-binding protein